MVETEVQENSENRDTLLFLFFLVFTSKSNYLNGKVD